MLNCFLKTSPPQIKDKITEVCFENIKDKYKYKSLNICLATDWKIYFATLYGYASENVRYKASNKLFQIYFFSKSCRM